MSSDPAAAEGRAAGRPAEDRTTPHTRPWLSWLLWTAMLAGVTAALIPFRGDLDQAHVVLTFLLIVLGASASGGRTLGLSLACVGFLLIDYYFQPPFDTITVSKGLDWIVLLAFLATAVVATQLLARARAERQVAEERAREIDRFASLGAETLNVARAEDALTAIAGVIRDAVAAARCEITVGDGGARGGAERHETYVAGESPPAATTHAVEIPLTVRGEAVGALRLVRAMPMTLDDAQQRSLSALSYYAALAVERARLAAEAQHAAALREADRLKDALLAAVSHDLRTPLTTIKALAHLAAARGDDGARLIETQADRLNHLVADLLDLSRLNGGALRVSPEVAAAEDLVGVAIREANDVHGSGRVVPVVERQGPLLIGRFDFAQSLRVLGNLIENAAKYSPPDAAIELRVERSGETLLFTVADRGMGVAASERERIFEAFYRGTTAPPNVGGAGLGLAIASRLAAAQGGSVTYAPREGGGSVFTLSLPAEETPVRLDSAEC